MHHHTDIEDFASRRPRGTSWKRCEQALRCLPRIPLDVCRSLGDSLTYVRTATPFPSPSHFTGHRRYRSVILALEETVILEVAQKRDLEPRDDYSDLTDRETFRGDGTPIRLEPGNVLVLDIDEAIRGASTLPVLGLVRLTVEAATFHNK
ncbi:beta-galactosidase subunit beta [Brachybacterium timonense]|uniref:beta-galactosidase subunit beta n=1 Tax=Brachybacterium timonense TaxID=2050896 RepID=UPI000D0B99A2|nr:beta-galactosidase subunit beta [Brachybacterium timonense]